MYMNIHSEHHLSDLKKIKYNRLIRNYLLNLVKYTTWDNNCRYKDCLKNYTVFCIDNNGILSTTNIRKMCRVLSLEYHSVTYNMIVDLIIDIYEVYGKTDKRN